MPLISSVLTLLAILAALRAEPIHLIDSRDSNALKRASPPLTITTCGTPDCHIPNQYQASWDIYYGVNNHFQITSYYLSRDLHPAEQLDFSTQNTDGNPDTSPTDFQCQSFTYTARLIGIYSGVRAGCSNTMGVIEVSLALVLILGTFSHDFTVLSTVATLTMMRAWARE